MSNNNTNQQQQQQMQQLPQVIAQYQQNIEFFNNNIATLRRNMERPDISQEEREVYKKQEQELQGKLALHQTLVNNLTPQMVAQSLQQRVLNQQQQQQQQQQMGSPASTADNMSTPGSPAQFNPQQQQQLQQQQQQLANFANTAAGAQQLRAAQLQHQQAMNKMGINVGPQQQHAQASPSSKPNAAAQAAVAAAAQAAQAAQAAVKNNNGMFTFPTTNTTTAPIASTPATPTTANPPATPTAPAPAPKPASAPSLDIDNQNRVLTKRKIQEMVSQIDPTERLEPEVEDILLEIADEFIESVTTFACQLAKHRKSDTLEVKDVQLHLERNWNIRIPGFASDDIRPLRKPTIPSSHQTKLQAVNTARSQIANSAHKKNTANNNTNNTTTTDHQN